MRAEVRIRHSTFGIRNAAIFLPCNPQSPIYNLKSERAVKGGSDFGLTWMGFFGTKIPSRFRLDIEGCSLTAAGRFGEWESEWGLEFGPESGAERREESGLEPGPERSMDRQGERKRDSGLDRVEDRQEEPEPESLEERGFELLLEPVEESALERAEQRGEQQGGWGRVFGAGCVRVDAMVVYGPRRS